MKKKETKKKRFKKPKILREMDIETRAGFCGSSGKVIIGQSGCLISQS
jgi:hypothetical protein